MIVAARDSNIKRFVYAASSSTYGDSLVLPKIEDRIGKPLSPYAVTKYVNELYADVFSKIYGLETIGLRYFNVFGPRQRSDGPYAAVIPLFFESFYKKTPPIIYGDGEQTRDFTFVFNVVEANILAMLNSNSLVINQIFNIAAGERTSLNSLATQISRLTNNENILPIYKNSRVGDVRDSLADISKAKNILEYIPKFTLREGLEIMNNSFGIDNKEFIF
jgi:UDP-N-acetylglucosamine 4-epimerase